MKRDYAALMLLNAISGFVFIIAELKHSAEMVLVLLPFPITFLIFGYGGEWFRITRLNDKPSIRPKDVQEIYKLAQFGLLILNIIVFFIVWFRPFFPTAGAGFWEIVIGILINGGIPLVTLNLDFVHPGRELARSRFMKQMPD